MTEAEETEMEYEPRDVDPQEASDPRPYCGFALGVIVFFGTFSLHVGSKSFFDAATWSLLWGGLFFVLGYIIGHIGDLLIVEMSEQQKQDEEERQEEQEEREEEEASEDEKGEAEDEAEQSEE